MTNDRGAPTAALLASVVFVLSLLVAIGGDIGHPERMLGRRIFDLPDWLTTPLEIVMQAGTRAAAVVVALVVLVMVRRWQPAACVLVAASAAWLSADLLKSAVDRPRPTRDTLGRAVRDVVERPGYPSTHAALATSIAAALTWGSAVPRAVVLASWLVAALTAVARVHLGVHWPLDVLGGAAIGVLASALTAVGSRRFGLRHEAPPCGSERATSPR